MLKKIAIVLLSTLPSISSTSAKSVDIDTWDLSHIYINDQAWFSDFQQAVDETKTLSSSLEEPLTNASHLLDILEQHTKTKKLIAKLYSYASLKADEDLRVLKYKEQLAQASAVNTQLTHATSSIMSKVAELPSSLVEDFLEESPQLDKHAFFLRDAIRQKTRFVADKYSEEENLRKQALPRAEFLRLQQQIQWPTITLSAGEAANLSPASFSYYRTLPNPIDRTKVFQAYWGAIVPHTDKFAQLLQSHVLQKITEARRQNYSNALYAQLAKENIPTSVYTTLISAAEHHLPTLHRFLELKEDLIGIANLKLEDLYAPIPDEKPFFSLPEAEAISLTIYQQLSNEYAAILEDGFMGQWMHARPQSGKRSGSYMQDAAYDVHPYIFLNYRNTYADLNAFTHEWAHAVHSVFSTQNNPFETSRYSRLTAELVAATNEIILEDHLIETANSNKEKLYFIYQALENIQTNFFHHAQIAKFEKDIHSIVEQNDSLSADMLNTLNKKAMERYWGPIDPIYSKSWATVPHYYNSFSIYLYASGMAGGALFNERLTAEPQQTIHKYINLLKAGGSDYPTKLLEKAGVDLTSNLAYNTLASRMNRLIDQAYDLLDKDKSSS